VPNPSEGTRSQTRIPSLDGWRAVSIALVLGTHCTSAVGFPHSLSPAFDRMFDGNLGVRFFFVISGFLITQLLLVENDRTGGISLSRFYVRRMLRILPIYFAYLAMLAVLQLCTPIRQPAIAWFGNLTFTTNYFASFDSGVSNHLWSLAVEEQFYLLWPCLLAFLLSHRTRMRTYSWILAAVLCSAACARVTNYLYATSGPAPFLFRDFSFFLYFDSLAIGCVCAFLLVRKADSVRRWTTRHPILLLLLALAMIAIPHVLRRRYALAAFTVIFGNPLQEVGFAALMVQSIILPRFGFYRALNLPLICAIGVLSYSLYIWQQIFMTRLGVFGMAQVWWMSFPYWLLSAFVVASISYNCLEKPVLRLRARFRS
jgi:peptidoglycan/LPS O-acetylase OafA/YrhL